MPGTWESSWAVVEGEGRATWAAEQKSWLPGSKSETLVIITHLPKVTEH